MEKTIEKANLRKISKQRPVVGEAAAEHQIRVKEKELKNAKAQVEMYKRELAGLQAKVEDLSGVDRLLQLENRLREGLMEKAELERKVKELERQHKE